MDSWKRCRCEAAITGEKDCNSMELELARRRRLQEMATEEGVIRFRTRSPFEGNGNEGHVMAHEVALRFPAWQMSLSLTEKCCAWVSGLVNHFIPTAKMICFHLFKIEEIMMDRINLIPDQEIRGVDIRGNYEI
jgi:hypothetical protein